MADLLIQGIYNVFNVGNLFAIFIGTVLGIIIGALPGLSSTMGVALLIPITFKMDPSAGLCMLGAIYCASVYGGSISAILLRTPGTSASVATTWDGYELTKQGLAGKALAMSTYSSMFGGLFSAVCLILIAPALAVMSLRFGPPERFFLAIFGLTIIITVSSESLIKGLISGFFGIAIATTGIDIISGNLRFIWGQVSLLDGIPLLPALIGLVSMSQAMILIETKRTKIEIKKNVIRDQIIPTIDDLRRTFVTIIRSSFIGTIVGIIPGAGTDTAAYFGYSEAKRNSKHPETFGKGDIEGVAASEAANNAVTGGSLVPTLTLGIPGNSVTAVFMGGLLIHGLIPGPALFTKYGVVTYTLLVSLFLANIAFAILGIIGVKSFIKVVKIPTYILSPLIITLSVIGSYALRNNVSDVVIMFFFGILGYIMEKGKFSTVPIILALILAPMAEKELRRSLLILGGSIFPAFQRPICIIVFLLIIVSLSVSFIRTIKLMKQSRA